MKKVRWGILGTALHARKALIPALQGSSNGEVVAIASRSLDKAKQAAAELGIPKAYGSYEELLADRDVDAVCNPLPVSMHAPWSIACAEAGKPTLCEKPFTRTAVEARAVIAAFRERSLPVAEAMMYRYHPVTQRVREIVCGGGIGSVIAIRSSFFVNTPPGDIRWQDETGGGSLLDVGCYCVAITRHVTGEEPVETKAVATWAVPDRVDTSLSGVLRFPSGAMGYFCSSLASSFDCSYDIMGSKGRLRVDRGGMVVWPGEDFTIEYWHDDTSERLVIPRANSYVLMVEDFAQSLLTGRPMKFGLDDTVGNMVAMDALLASARAPMAS